MNTDDLIAALAADRWPQPPPVRQIAVALGVGAAVAAWLFTIGLGVRPDLGAALHTVRFPVKFVLTVALAAVSVHLVWTLARPGSAVRRAARWLMVPAALVALALLAELAAVRPAEWAARLVGSNAVVCLTAIPLLSIAPLAALIVALRRLAPTAPAPAGAAAGLAAGAVAATLYAAHCTDDSPLFVALWYTLALAFVTAAGAALGARLLRW